MDKTVLCYIEKDHSYLMMYRNKKANDLNEQKWIGIGGHLEKGETKEQALIREVKEETGLTLKSFKYRGDIIFQNDDYEETMYLYTSNAFSGELINCDEGELHWISFDKIMDLNLWEGDKAFLPKLMNTNEFIKLRVIYKGKELVKVVEEK